MHAGCPPSLHNKLTYSLAFPLHPTTASQPPPASPVHLPPQQSSTFKDNTPSSGSKTHSSGASSYSFPALLSPSQVVPLDAFDSHTPSPTSSHSHSQRASPTSRTRRRVSASDSIYRQALERLDHASLTDDQMLSSFKRMSIHHALSRYSVID